MEAVGSLSRTVIRQTVSAAQDDIRECYVTRVEARPLPTGRVVTSFIIAVNGTIQAAAIGYTSPELDLPELHRCLLGVIRALRFPPPDGGGVVGVNYPWQFHASDLRTELRGVTIEPTDAAELALVEAELRAHVGATVDCFLGDELAYAMANTAALHFELTVQNRRIIAASIHSLPTELAGLETCLRQSFAGRQFEISTSGPATVGLDLLLRPW